MGDWRAQGQAMRRRSGAPSSHTGYARTTIPDSPDFADMPNAYDQAANQQKAQASLGMDPGMLYGTGQKSVSVRYPSGFQHDIVDER